MKSIPNEKKKFYVDSIQKNLGNSNKHHLFHITEPISVSVAKGKYSIIGEWHAKMSCDGPYLMILIYIFPDVQDLCLWVWGSRNCHDIQGNVTRIDNSVYI